MKQLFGRLLMGNKNIAHKQPTKKWDGKQYKQTLPEKFHTNVFSIRSGRISFIGDTLTKA